MTPILTAAQMKACDIHTVNTLGTPSRTLMERAAHKAVGVLTTRVDLFPKGKVLHLCGGGNNGGDGFAMARFLIKERGRKASVVYVGQMNGGTPDASAMSPECHRQYTMAVSAGVPVHSMSDLEGAMKGATAVVDAVFGIGLDRPVAGEVAKLLDDVAASGLPVLAVDIPSGIHADTGAVMGTALPAVLTVTMQALKAGLLLYPGGDYCGEITVAELGIDTSIVRYPKGYLADDSLLRRVLLPRARRTHKGTYGRLALLCGSESMCGASVLATRAALRSGVGLADTLTVPANRHVLYTSVPEAIVTDRTQCEGLEKSLKSADGVVMGCGLGLSGEAYETLRTALRMIPADGSVPVVLDADGLNLLAADPSLWGSPLLSASQKQVVMTPHPAEMARLSGLSVEEILEDTASAALDLARERGVTVVLKDAHTVVASPEGQLYICIAGNAGLAKGGNGDALAGIIGALLTQNRHRLGQEITVAEVVAAAVYLHAAAADLAADAVGEYSMTAGDVIEKISMVCKDFSHSKTRLTQG